jgi:hypothetical protein
MGLNGPERGPREQLNDRWAAAQGRDALQTRPGLERLHFSKRLDLAQLLGLLNRFGSLGSHFDFPFDEKPDSDAALSKAGFPS